MNLNRQKICRVLDLGFCGNSIIELVSLILATFLVDGLWVSCKVWSLCLCNLKLLPLLEELED